MAHKTRKRPAHNQWANTSFENRYGMKRSEWADKKRALRSEGNGAEIAEIRDKAYKKAKHHA